MERLREDNKLFLTWEQLVDYLFNNKTTRGTRIPWLSEKALTRCTPGTGCMSPRRFSDLPYQVEPVPITRRLRREGSANSPGAGQRKRRFMMQKFTHAISLLENVQELPPECKCEFARRKGITYYISSITAWPSFICMVCEKYLPSG